MAVAGRTCGTCTQCCKALAIRELDKPANRWCSHCEPGAGCRIYGDRPDPCRRFACGWLVHPLPDELRPDRCKVVMFEPAATPHILALHVDPDFPDAWRQKSIAALVRAYVRKGGEVRVVAGDLRYRINRDGLTGPHRKP